MAAHVREIGILTDWARRTSTGGGRMERHQPGRPDQPACRIPRGQLAHAPCRPTRWRSTPPSEGIEEIGLTGEIAKGFRRRPRAPRSRWTEEILRGWRPLTDPVQPPAMGPENVFMVLGTEDRITPFEHGIGIARRWGVPEDQVFIRPQGHFSVPAGLMVDEAPVAAFANHLKRL